MRDILERPVGKMLGIAGLTERYGFSKWMVLNSDAEEMGDLEWIFLALQIDLKREVGRLELS